MKLLSMSGFIPEHICDITRFAQYSGETNIAHFCGYAADFISQVIQDRDIDGAVFPRSCDSTRIISSYLQECKKFVYQFEIPCNGVIGSEAFYADEIKNFKKKVESYYGIMIDESVVLDRTIKINKRNKEIRELYKEIDSVSFADFVYSIHEMLKKPLCEQTTDSFSINGCGSGKKVYVLGSFLSNVEIIRNMEKVGLNIVGDALPESGRLVSQPDVYIEKGGDIYLSIAKSILNQRLSPTQNAFKRCLEKDFEIIKSKKVKGVVFVTQQYCEPYYYYYAIARKAFEDSGIPTTQVTINGTDDGQKSLLTLEAFADII